MEQAIPNHGRSDAALLQQALVDSLKHQGLIVTPLVEQAFRAVPRHLFLPDVALDTVYRNIHIVTKQQDGRPLSSSSQPGVMAIMLELLDLHPGQRILEIGTGTGYNAALLAHMVGDTGQVTTVEIDEDIVAVAREHLKAARFEHVHVMCGDGGFGYPSAAPYDRIILTVAAPDIAPAWFEQLAPGGRLVLPLELIPFRSRLTMQLLVAFDRMQDSLTSVAVRVTQFISLRGSLASPTEAPIALGPDPGLILVTRASVDAVAIYTALTHPGHDEAVMVRITLGELGGLYFWLALHEPRFCDLYAEGDLAARDIVPLLAGMPGSFVATIGLCEQTTLCVLLCSPDTSPFSDHSVDPEKPFDLLVRTFGPTTSLAQRLVEHVLTWERAGRPFVWTPGWAMEDLRIRAYRQKTVYTPSVNEVVVDKQWSRLVCDWQKS